MNPEDVASKKVTLEDCLHSFSVNSSNKEVDSELKKKGKRKFDLQVIDWGIEQLEVSKQRRTS